MTTRTWYRIAGRLWEDLTFEPEPGWETDTRARRPAEGDGTWVMELVDGAERTIVGACPDVRFPKRTGPMRATRVVAYLPAHPAARRVRLRRGEFEVWSREVAIDPPRVKDVQVALDGPRTATITWTARHPDDDPLVHRVVWLAPGKGAFPVGGVLHEPRLEVRLADLPGSPSGRFAVLVSDGLRSARAVSEAVSVSAGGAQVAILEPAPHAVVPSGQAITLRAVAHDDAGRRLDEDGFVWLLDGEPVLRDRHLAILEPPETGDHTLVCAWEGAGAGRGETRLRFTVKGAKKLPAPKRPRPTPAPNDDGDAMGDGRLRIKL